MRSETFQGELWWQFRRFCQPISWTVLSLSKSSKSFSSLIRSFSAADVVGLAKQACCQGSSEAVKISEKTVPLDRIGLPPSEAVKISEKTVPLDRIGLPPIIRVVFLSESELVAAVSKVRQFALLVCCLFMAAICRAFNLCSFRQQMNVAIGHVAMDEQRPIYPPHVW